MFIKIGESLVNESNILNENVVLSDPEIRSRFEKLATDLKKIAPKAKKPLMTNQNAALCKLRYPSARYVLYHGYLKIDRAFPK